LGGLRGSGKRDRGCEENGLNDAHDASMAFGAFYDSSSMTSGSEL
jgi:hypothetical protein